MTSYLFRMPAGIPGAGNRIGAGATIEAGLLHATLAPTTYGVPVTVDASTGSYRAIASPDTAALVAGVLIRPYPSSSGGTAGDVLNAGTPSLKWAADIMRRGYVSILLGGATAAAKGGLVYIRILNAAGGKPIGGFEAAADGGNTVVMPATWYFMGPADANGNCELAVNT